MLVPVILASHKDIKYGKEIEKYLARYDIDVEIRICSAHNYPTRILDIISQYEKRLESCDDVAVIITVTGKSNALGGLVDSNTFIPVITCPVVTNASIHDIHSSLSMPSGVAPLVILNPSNAALAALKICAIKDNVLRKQIRKIHKEKQIILNLEDIRNKKYINFEPSGKPSFEEFGNFIKSGKIRDIYELSENNSYKEQKCIALVATDRLSVFDKILCKIPNKDYVLNSVSSWWFNKTKNLVPNHIIDSSFRTTSVVKKCNVIPIEFVVRSYMTGSTSTSIWKNYEAGMRNYCGNKLREGYIKNDKLDEVILTPTTKSGVHDELISKEEIINRGIMTKERWDICEDYAAKLFSYGQELCEKKGLILVDTKYEFGIDENGKILLIGELHTPDSSRFWFRHNYEESRLKGLEPDHFDKEIIRKWVRRNYNPYDIDEEIVIPRKLISTVSNVYLQMMEVLTS